jgi:hypothetical protein
MTVEGSLNSAMQTLSSLYSGEVGGAIAVKVLKDQMDQQQQLISTLTQPSRIVASEAYDKNGRTLVLPEPPQFDTKI